MLYAYTVWLTPLWAAFPGLSSGMLVILAGIKVFSSGSLTAFLYGTGLPTFAATTAWRFSSRYPFSFFVLWPLAAFAVFAATVGFTAHLLYAAYWLVLPVLYVAAPAMRSNRIVQAIVASMTAHTVGALLVLCFGSFASWSSLVPVVPFERMVAAAGMLLTALGMESAHRCAQIMVRRLRAE